MTDTYWNQYRWLCTNCGARGRWRYGRYAAELLGLAHVDRANTPLGARTHFDADIEIETRREP